MTFPTDAPAPGPSAPQGTQAGDILADRYELVSRIGDGGHGAVWRAHDRLLQRDVAVKEVKLPLELPPDEREQTVERTLREARTAASLSHASIVRVFDVVSAGGLPWIVMELLQARSLAEIISAEGAMPPRVAAKIGLSLAGALEAAHAAGIVHRDVKPSNVLISADGRCVLTDFGAAAGVSGTGHTAPGMVLGSAHYIAPERAVGGPAEPASDVFSLGVTLYAAVEGRPPFDRGDTTETMHAVVNDAPESPLRAGPITPLLGAMLEKDPQRRASVEFARNTLTALLSGPLAPEGQVSGGPTSAAPTSPVPPPMSPAPPQATAMYPQQTPPGPPPAGPPPVGPPPSDPYAGVPGQPGPGYGSPPYGTPPYGGAQQQSGPPYGGPSRREPRKLAPKLLAVGLAAAVIAVAVVLGVQFFGGGEDPPGPESAGSQESAEPDLATEEFADPDGRYVAQVPEGWADNAEKGGETYYNVADPEDAEAWLRFNVPGGEGDPGTTLQNAEGRFVDGCCSLDAGSYQRVGDIRDGELDGMPAKILEYTSVKDGTPRHAIWLIAAGEGVNYHVYLSVPEERFEELQPYWENAVETFSRA